MPPAVVDGRDSLPPATLDGLQGIEEQVKARIADRLRGAPAAYLPTTDEDSCQDEPTQASRRRRSKDVSFKLRTADTTVVHQVTWPYEVIYSPSAQLAIYDQLSSMAFVDGCITVMSTESPHIKVIMLTHLQELMEDWEHYGWLAVRAYHATWLHHMEQGHAKVKLHHVLVLYRVMLSTASSHASTSPS